MRVPVFHRRRCVKGVKVSVLLSRFFLRVECLLRRFVPMHPPPPVSSFRRDIRHLLDATRLPLIRSMPSPCLPLSLTPPAQVENGTCKATLVDSVTAAYRVAGDYCGLDILSETFNDEHCRSNAP